jgi:hypothetical protein
MLTKEPEILVCRPLYIGELMNFNRVAYGALQEMMWKLKADGYTGIPLTQEQIAEYTVMLPHHKLMLGMVNINMPTMHLVIGKDAFGIILN